ncbi:MAG: hypothetical protein R2877_04840 [Bdellovibrionota bacterium]
MANFGNVQVTYLLHQGDGLLNGFEGSPIINSKGEVVGSIPTAIFTSSTSDMIFPHLQRLKNPEKPILVNMSMSGNVQTDQYVMSLQDSDRSIIDNDGFDEALFVHRAMQTSKIDDFLEMFFQTLMVKISQIHCATPTAPKVGCSIFRRWTICWT